jgi:Fe(3+) dicitrate transport protein
LNYNNRLGTLALQEGNVFYLYRTNIGSSITDGLETFLQYTVNTGKKLRINLFTSTAVFNGHYTTAQVISWNENVIINGNKIESVPNVITRNGINFQLPAASVSFLYSYVGETFSDALNTENPTSNGAIGKVPAYGLFDINSSFLLLKQVMVRVNINNVFNKSYFTKRPSFYPGPGIWPSDGRSINVSIGFRL